MNSWNDRLASAATIDAVVAAMDEYLQDLNADDVYRLPRHYRPGRLDGPEAIERWSEQLARYELPLSQDPRNRELFIELRDCFAQAARRIAELSSPASSRPLANASNSD